MYNLRTKIIMEILKYKYYIPTLFRSMEFALYKMTWQIQNFS